MVEALTTRQRRVPILLGLLVISTAVFAHRLDEYLQATLVSIEPTGVRFQINLTPGIDVSGKVLIQIDRDNDGKISNEESAAYAELLKRDLTARLDGKELKLKLTASTFPNPAELRNGLGIIQIEFSGIFSSLAAGAHKLAFDNRHLPALSVYLINAAQPKSRAIRIISQKRTDNQSAGEIEFTFHPPGWP